MLMIEHFAGTTRRMIGWRFERSFRAYSLAGYIGGVQRAPTAMRMLQTSTALLENRARFRTMVHVCATQH